MDVFKAWPGRAESIVISQESYMGCTGGVGPGGGGGAPGAGGEAGGWGGVGAGGGAWVFFGGHGRRGPGAS